MAEEFASPAHQQFDALRGSYDALLTTWRELSEDHKLLRKREEAYSQKHAEILAARDEAAKALNTATWSNKQMESQMANRIQELERLLEEARKKPGVAELTARLQEANEQGAELMSECEKTKVELYDVRTQRTELEWKLGQMRVAMLKKGKKKKGKSKGVG